MVGVWDHHDPQGWWEQLIGRLISLGAGHQPPERQRSSGRAERKMDAPPVSETKIFRYIKVVCHNTVLIRVIIVGAFVNNELDPFLFSSKPSTRN